MAFDKKFYPANLPDAVGGGLYVVDGILPVAPTNASTKTANRVNITGGTVYVRGKALTVDLAADQSCIQSVGGAVVADEKGQCFALLAIIIKGTNVPVLRWVAGTAVTFVTSHALTLAPLPTQAQIEAIYGAGVEYLNLGSTKISRTGDTTMAQTFDLSEREGRGVGA